jgi:peptide-methionine (S)-S-oxide reductase
MSVTMPAFVVHAGAALARAVSMGIPHAAQTSKTLVSQRISAADVSRSSFMSRQGWRLGQSRLLALGSGPSCGAQRTIMRVAKDGDTVEIHYTGTLEDGSEFDSSRKRGIPFAFTVGSGQVIPGFDEAVRGLSVGESTRAVIPPERGYGQRDEANILSVSRDSTPNDMDFSVGAKVPLSNGSTGVVLEADSKQIRLDANHHLAGKTLTFDMELVAFVDGILGAPASGLQRLLCAAGCFWGIELAFQRVPGVVSTRVGYTQGKKEYPKYREVCSGSTGHTEAVAVDFDPSVTSYEKMLDVFWDRLGRSALTRNQAGNDVGTQYRSGIYFLNEEQRAAAQKSAKDASERLGKPVVTEIRAADGNPFYLAEE